MNKTMRFIDNAPLVTAIIGVIVGMGLVVFAIITRDDSEKIETEPFHTHQELCFDTLKINGQYFKHKDTGEIGQFAIKCPSK